MPAFQETVRQEFGGMLARCRAELPPGKRLRIDLHCHDRHSDRADEKCGRILNISESWLPTDSLVESLRRGGCDALTITNHNNARSCWDLMERGVDILPGAEFDCLLPEERVVLHVLTYGFTPAEEAQLNLLRRNLYRFLEYCADRGLPTVLAHPLFFRAMPKAAPGIALLEKMSLLFERFEAVNGQRNSWQNLLLGSWIREQTPETLEAMGRRHGLRPGLFCRDPYRKRLTGGSDDHIGVFSGLTGTFLVAPADTPAGLSAPAQALAALRNGYTAPFGEYQDGGKITVTLLDYFCQAVGHFRDPGLLRILLHKGTASERLSAFAVSNAIAELRRHRLTTRFLRIFHEALHGGKIGWVKRRLVPKPYRPLLADVDSLAQALRVNPSGAAAACEAGVLSMYRQFQNLAVARLKPHLERLSEAAEQNPAGVSDFLGKMEIPSQLRSLFGGTDEADHAFDGLNLGKLLDDLSFPLLGLGVIAGVHFAGAQALNGNRHFANLVARRLGCHGQPGRALWLTDDPNGPTRALWDEMGKIGCPVDIALLSDHAFDGPGPNFRRLDTVLIVPAPGFPGHTLRVPDLLSLHQLMRSGGYDRVICDSESFLALGALYLKHAFNVPAYFFSRRDWMAYARTTLRFDAENLARLKRILRGLYQGFDGVMTRDQGHRNRLLGPAMQLAPEKVAWTGPGTDVILEFIGLAEHPVAVAPGAFAITPGGALIDGATPSPARKACHPFLAD